MKKETQTKLEYLMFGLEVVLLATEELLKDNFYSKEIKFYGNKLYDAIQLKYSKGFKQSTPKAMDYYVRLMDWQGLQSDVFAKLEKLKEEDKVRYLMALDNFNTMNLK
jgi:hypothetical protein